MSLNAVITKNPSRISSFLYLKGRIFYYRRRIPKPLRDMGCPNEIRICLHTPYQNVARRMVSCLHHLTATALEGWNMKEKHEDAQQQLKALTSMMREQVKAILNSDDKKIISNQEIQDRLDSYLRQRLDEDSFATDLPPYAEIHSPDKPVEIITVGDEMHDKAEDIKHDLNTGDNYDEHFHQAILELTSANVFNPSEISEENAQKLVKAYMIMQINFHKILEARYNGDHARKNTCATHG